MPRKDLTHEEEMELTDAPAATWLDNVERGVNPYTGDDLSDMPTSQPLTDDDVNAMAEHDEQTQRVMKMFPMFFTARGNTITPPSGKRLVVTGKNFVTLSDAIADLKLNVRSGAMLVVRSDAWSLMISAPASKAFCDTGLLDAIFLAGWTVQSLNNG